MGIIKGIWNLLTVFVAVSYFGVLTAATIALGRCAISLHETEFFSLSKYNHMLVEKK